MEDLTYDKAKVLERLQANKDTHRAKVEQTWEGYREQVTAELERQLNQAKQGKPVDPNFLRVFPVPLDYTKEYDRVIDRLNSSDDKTVTLTEHEFNNFMRDEWDWQDRFVATSSVYVNH